MKLRESDPEREKGGSGTRKGGIRQNSLEGVHARRKGLEREDKPKHELVVVSMGRHRARPFSIELAPVSVEDVQHEHRHGGGLRSV